MTNLDKAGMVEHKVLLTEPVHKTQTTKAGSMSAAEVW